MDPTTDNEPEVQLSDDEWRKRLTKDQYVVLRKKGTEKPFTGEYWDNHEKGVYVCAACGALLFDSDAKFDSGTGWPSFTEPMMEENVVRREDRSHGIVRTEVLCRHCGGHLGHVFDDGPDPAGCRFCMNSVSLKFVPQM